MKRIYEGYDFIDEGVLRLQLDKILFANRYALDLFHCTSDQIQHMSIADIPLGSIPWKLSEQGVTLEGRIKESLENYKFIDQYFTLETTKTIVKVHLFPIVGTDTFVGQDISFIRKR